MLAGSGKTWKIHNPDRELVEEISSGLGISRLVSRLLVNRGICQISEANSFLENELSSLSNPSMMIDSRKAAKRVIEALKKDEKIIIYADYDVDGATGAACFYLFMKEIFPDCHISIHQNDRIRDGYGVKYSYLEDAYRCGFGLAVTVDCGISNFKEIEDATRLGLDVIVTDHHSVGDRVPQALAVLNPRRSDCPYPFKGLSGVGVVFSLLCVVRKELREEGFFNGREEPKLITYLDLVALGTVADLAPLTGDNRILVKHGIDQIRKNPRPGIEALVNVSGLRKEYLNEVDLSFRIGPRLNAAGRIGDPLLSSAILVEDSIARANDMARLLSKENSKRQAEEGKIFKEAVNIIKEKATHEDRVIVVGSEGWHLGVVGIVASKIQEKYSRPAIVLSFQGDEARGSGRSRKPVDILELLKRCSKYIEQFGGHPQAVGLRVKRENVQLFAQAMQQEVMLMLGDKAPETYVNVDSEVTLNELSDSFIEEIDILSPFGIGNPEPLFLATNLQVFGISKGRRASIHFNVSQGNASFEAILFKKKSLEWEESSRVDLLFTPRVSTYRGRKKAKLFVRDLRKH